ncbi:hypothetical protein [Planctomycetes bacterium Pan216]
MLRARAILLTALVGLALGCSESGPHRFKVTGKATFDGNVIPVGEIRFRPDTEKGGSGPGSVAKIQDGAFTMGLGLVPGPHLATIYGFDGVAFEDVSEGQPLFRPYTTSVDVPDEDIVIDINVPGRMK